MNIQLVNALSSAPTSGGGGISLPLSDASENKKAFATLLGEKEELNLNSSNSELIGMLNVLDVSPQEQKNLFSKLDKLSSSLSEKDKDALMKELSVLRTTPKTVKTLVSKMENAENPKQILAALQQNLSERPAVVNQRIDLKGPKAAQTQATLSMANNPITIPPQTQNASLNPSDFIASTLSIANESKSMRLKAQASDSTLSVSKNSRSAQGNKSDGWAITNEKLIDLKGENKRDMFQSTLNAMAERTDSVTPRGLPLPLGEAFSVSEQQVALTPAPSPLSILAKNTQITTPITQPEQWGADFSRVMVKMSQQATQVGQPSVQTAEIRLNPAELGPIRIMLSVNEGVANAMIFAAHTQTRQVIEQAIPQLQQQLSQSGLSLGEANVSDQGLPDQSDAHFNQKERQSAIPFTLDSASVSQVNEESLEAPLSANPLHPDALVSTFA